MSKRSDLFGSFLEAIRIELDREVVPESTSGGPGERPVRRRLNVSITLERSTAGTWDVFGEPQVTVEAVDDEGKT